VTCVECGAKARRSRRCRRCGAPVIERAEDRAPGIQMVSQDGVDEPGAFQQAETPETAVPAPSAPGGPNWSARVLVGFLNFVALWFLIAFTGMFLTRGSWDSSGENIYGYPPPRACLLGAISCGSVLVLTVAVIVCRRIRHAGRRQALDSELPSQLPETAV
jgi:hypothetical protein